MKICARCDEPMSDAASMPLDKTSDSGPGMTLFVHARLCTAQPHQTAPVSEREPARGR